MLYGDITDGNITGVAGRALAYLRDGAAALPDGKSDLWDGLYADMKLCYHPAPAAERPWENHARYVDIQYVFDGEEMIYVRPAAGMAVKDDFLAERDVAFLHEPSGKEEEYAFRLTPGKFLLLLPGEAHKAECLSGPRVGKKIIIKIPAALLQARA